MLPVAGRHVQNRFDESGSRGAGGATPRSLDTYYPPPTNRWPEAPLGGGGGGWHKALVVGSVGLWQRLLASRP